MVFVRFCRRTQGNSNFFPFKNKKRPTCKGCFFSAKNYKYADFSGESYFGVFIGQNTQRFVVDFYEDSVSFVTERQWAAVQKITEKDDRVTIEFTSTQYDKVLRWVLSCGCNAIPKFPKKLVNDWKGHILEIRKLLTK
jgi:hypothetical protein